ncbi:hypothetical protein EG329_003121 [Mollisiaceae sp. DMI_Dod_QoI]|nr:hypothetical protein EG329_003121 [Helotiales sp. DMI_Dod_QoI]
MESRGNVVGGPPKDRLAIARRSLMQQCDQCRARKLVNHSGHIKSLSYSCAKLLNQSLSEQKIDGIATAIDNINLLLRGLDTSPNTKHPDNSTFVNHPARFDLAKPLTGSIPVSASVSEPQWNYSTHIIDLVKAVVEGSDARYNSPKGHETISSLRRLLQTLECSTPPPRLNFPTVDLGKHYANSSLPPLEAAVAVLRWVKSHEDHIKTTWISRILPLEMFAEICRKVYFAVEDYDDVDFILANGYLYYMFSEHVIVSGLDENREYYTLCRENFQNAFSQLPLLLSPSMKVVAALTLGTFNAVENCKSSQAWTFISTAANFCQTLGYHRSHPPRGDNDSLLATQRRLFWTVYKVEKGLSLRLGRSSTIRDVDITLPIDQTRPTRLGRIQGQVYDQLYSPAGLSQPYNAERGRMAEALAKELRDVIKETRSEVADAITNSSDRQADTLRVLFLKFDLVCESALLTLILRAIPPAWPSQSDGDSDGCIAVACEVLDMHQQCMIGIRGCTNDPFLIVRAILYTPFVPFNILFTRAVHFSDLADLARLDRFAASLLPEASPPDSITHPYRLYQLLCEAARLYIEANISSSSSLPIATDLTHGVRESSGGFDLTHFGTEVGTAGNDLAGPDDSQNYGLSDWYLGNQQLMNLLDEDIMVWPST